MTDTTEQSVNNNHPLKGKCPENEYWTNCSGCELQCGDDENVCLTSNTPS